MSFSTISVIGLGYIGLPTAAAFASRQKRVVGVDVNQHAVETINRGEIHIVEPDLASVVKTAVEQGYLSATTTPVEADAYLIAVPTPFKRSPRAGYGVCRVGRQIHCVDVKERVAGDPRVHLTGRVDRTDGRVAGGDAPGS